MSKTISTGDFRRKPTPEEQGKSRWYKYSGSIDIVWCDEDGRAWSAYDSQSDKATREYSSRAELTAALDNGTVQWF